MKVIQKNGLRLREYPAVFEEQAVTKTLATDACEEGIGSPLSVPLAGSFEDSDNFYFLTVRTADTEARSMLIAPPGLLPARRPHEVDEAPRNGASAPSTPLVRRAGESSPG